MYQENQKKENNGIFNIKTGNEWLEDVKCAPIPKSLFMDCWFEGEACILFAETNVGKSILAVQIGIEIAQSQPVIYFDFELSAKQFEGRYSNNYSDHFNFPKNFKRAELESSRMDFKKAGYASAEDLIYASIKNCIQSSNVKILIIDNLTYLRTETEKAKDALLLMHYLTELKKEFGLSILVLAHTPKRDRSLPISRNDLGGSRMLMNLCDSSFAIGESRQGKDIRYIKQIKVRATSMKYDSDNVLVFRLSKPRNFLAFINETGERVNSEQEHLQIDPQKARKYSLSKKIYSLHSQGIPFKEISNTIKVSTGLISKITNSPEYAMAIHDIENSVNSIVHDVHDVHGNAEIEPAINAIKPIIIQQREVVRKNGKYNFSKVKSASILDLANRDYWNNTNI